MNELCESLKRIHFETNQSKAVSFSILPQMLAYISSRELMHSDIIAELLRCRTNDFAILRQFLIDIGIADLQPAVNEIPEVHTERGVENRRRIDILITWGSNAVIIENKLNDARDQSNQLSDYCTSIINECFDIKKVVYMPLYRSKSAPDKVGEHDVVNFYPADIIKWLESSKEKLRECSDEWLACKNYSDLLKHINIKNKNFMNATSILESLTSDAEFDKILEIARVVNSPDWYNAILTGISDKVKLRVSGVNSQFKGSTYMQLWLENYNYWIELWMNKNEIKLWLHTDKLSLAIDGFTKWVEDESYYINEAPIYLYPSESESLIDYVVELLKKSTDQ